MPYFDHIGHPRAGITGEAFT